MKRNYGFFALMGIAMLAMIACEPINTPVDPDPQDTTKVPVDTTQVPTDTTEVPTDSTFVPFSFPKKHLIEEFTGQDCGYCPYGMDCIHEFMGDETNWVLILHHYGYQADHFSVSGSKTITSKLGVSGAPSSAINRAKTKTGAGNKIVFHPGYLPECDKSQFATETYASIHIENEYDASMRELKVKVSGEIGIEEAPQLFLTVLVKESGMIDYQADYYNSYEGWQEFRHCNAVRAYLTAPVGDSVFVNNHAYSQEFTLLLNDKFVPENCMVVAFLTEAFKPVVQAEESPVVEGTTGGADILHGGITLVPVEDYYPEPNATDGPVALSGHLNGESMTTTAAWYTQYAQYTEWYIQSYSMTAISLKGNTCAPFAGIYLFTEPGTTTIPEGTYEINNSLQPGTVWAGFRDDSQVMIDGSMFYFINYSYLQQGYLVPVYQWLIAEGTLTVSASSWSLEGKTRNGGDIKLVGTTAIQNKGKQSAPQKIQKLREKTAFGFEYMH